jgi:REP element-mobilizing transposase RayT
MKRFSAFYQLVYHFVWTTKERLPLLTPTIEARLLPYIGSKCHEWGYTLHAVNGAENHLHLLLSLTPMMIVAEVAHNLKGASTHYINKESGLNESLYWQDGYAVVTLRQAEIPKVTKYIERQKEHHQTGKLSTLLEQIGA